MMKRLIFSAVAVGLMMSSMAHAEEPMFDKFEICRSVAGLAEKIFMLRHEMPFDEFAAKYLTDPTENTYEVKEMMARDAYLRTAYSNRSIVELRAAEFRNDWALNCFKQFDNL